MAPWFLNLSLSLCSQHFVSSRIFHLYSQLLEAGPEKTSSTCPVICPNNPIRENHQSFIFIWDHFLFWETRFSIWNLYFPLLFNELILLCSFGYHTLEMTNSFIFLIIFFFLTMFVRSSQVLKQQKERGKWSLHVSYCCSERNKLFICLVLCVSLDYMHSLRTSLTDSECSITTVPRCLLSCLVGGNSSHVVQFLSLN